MSEVPSLSRGRLQYLGFGCWLIKRENSSCFLEYITFARSISSVKMWPLKQFTCKSLSCDINWLTKEDKEEHQCVLLGRNMGRKCGKSPQQIKTTYMYNPAIYMFTAPFNNMLTLKLKAQPTNAFFTTVNQTFGGSSQLPATVETVHCLNCYWKAQ